MPGKSSPLIVRVPRVILGPIWSIWSDQSLYNTAVHCVAQLCKIDVLSFNAYYVSFFDKFVVSHLFSSSYLVHWKIKNVSNISKLTSWFRGWRLTIDLTHQHKKRNVQWPSNHADRLDYSTRWISLVLPGGDTSSLVLSRPWGRGCANQVFQPLGPLFGLEVN